MKTDSGLKETKAQTSQRDTPRWKRVLDRRLPDLRVLYSGDDVLGFVYKLADTSTGRSQWCCNIGCGDSAKLVGHRWTLEQAKLNVEESAASNLNISATNTATI